MNPTRHAIFLVILAGLWVVWILRLYYDGQHLDLSALYLAGWLWGNGQEQAIFTAPPDVFGPDQPALWREVWASAEGERVQHFTAYVYPPIWAAALSPFTHGTDPMAFFHTVYLWHVAALLAAAWMGWRLTHDGLPALGWALALFAILAAGMPALNAFLLNQPQVTIIALVLLAFLLVQRGHDIAGGAVLGLAAAIKLSPVLFALLFVFNRRWRALAATLAVSGGLALVSLAVAGWPLHALFLERLAQIDSLIVQTRVNFSPELLVWQLSELLAGRPVADGRIAQTITAPEPAWLATATTAAFLAALAALWLCTRRLPDPLRLPVQLLALSLIAALLGPLGWAHYYLLPLLLLPVLFRVMPRGRAWALIAAFVIATSFPLYLLAHAANHLVMATAIAPVLAACWLLAALLVAGRRHVATRPAGP